MSRVAPLLVSRRALASASGFCCARQAQWQLAQAARLPPRTFNFAHRSLHSTAIRQPVASSSIAASLSMSSTIRSSPCSVSLLATGHAAIRSASTLAMSGAPLSQTLPVATPIRKAALDRGSAPTHRDSSSSQELPRLTDPIVVPYLLTISTMVFFIVILGGLTRLTESGLSITEWELVTGVLPPLTHDQWQVEFAKYKATPEGQITNKNMGMKEFQSIFWMEWSHRMLGRVIGLAFLLPIPYLIYRRRLNRQSGAALFTIATLIGAQGALGWYMVKSGLTHAALAEANPSGVPRVSQYRLAAHLGMAFIVYAASLRVALGIGRDWSLAAKSTGLSGLPSVASTISTLQSRTAGRTRIILTALTGLVFLTALSGAFVAGLDAGLVYNEFPYMGEHLVPPRAELFDARYARDKDGHTDLIRRNIFENPTTVQFDHRTLAETTFVSILGVWLYARRPLVRNALPPQTYKWITASMSMAVLQVSLGISTLVYLVPTPLAAAHQAGSLVLLSLCIAAGASLRRPGKAARQWLARRPAPVKAAYARPLTTQ